VGETQPKTERTRSRLPAITSLTTALVNGRPRPLPSTPHVPCHFKPKTESENTWGNPYLESKILIASRQRSLCSIHLLVVNDLITPSATITASCCIPSQGRKLREALRAYHREFCQDHTHDCRVAILQEIRIILPVVCLSNYSLISPPKVKSRVKVNHQALSPYYPPGSHLPTA
jgi:hypothetical protein